MPRRRLSKPKAQPKGKTRKQLKARQQRADAKRAQAFRDAVWAREIARFAAAFPKVDAGPDFANCQQPGCYKMLCREAREGHVHHLRGRNVAPEDRYNPDAAVLLCATCHRAVHDGKITLASR